MSGEDTAVLIFFAVVLALGAWGLAMDVRRVYREREECFEAIDTLSSLDPRILEAFGSSRCGFDDQVSVDKILEYNDLKAEERIQRYNDEKLHKIREVYRAEEGDDD